jgi:hypothetical protein
MQQGQVLMLGLIAFALLGPAEYARISLTMSAMASLVALGSMSSSVVVYRASLDPANGDAVIGALVGRIVAMLLFASSIGAGVVASAYMLGADLVASKLARPVELAAVLCFLVASIMASYQQGLIFGRMSLSGFVWTNGILFCSAIPLGVLVVGENGLSGYFAILGLLIGARAVVLHIQIRRAFPGGAVEFPNFGKLLSGFVVPATIACLTTLPSFWAASEIVYGLDGGNLALGSLAILITLKQVPFLLCSTAVSNLGRVVFQAHDSNQMEALRGFRRLFRTMLIGAIVLSILFFILAIAGVEAMSSRWVLDRHMVTKQAMGVSLLLVLEVLAMVVYVPVTRSGHMWESFWFIAFPRDCALVVITLLLAESMAWDSIVIALVASQFIGLVLTVFQVWRNKTTCGYVRMLMGRQRDG